VSTELSPLERLVPFADLLRVVSVSFSRRIGIPHDATGTIEDLPVPTSESGLGPYATALLAMITSIQEGRIAGPKGWGVVCQSTQV